MARSRAEALTAGRVLRGTLPRSAQSRRAPADRDAVEILVQQHTTRLPDLVGVRVGRMLESPFTFYRGTAAVMAHDLAHEARTGVHVVACGDAHVSNFGFFASPERSLLFDLNDFDEAAAAPWEWDVKRLAASVHVGGRDAGMSEDACREAARGTVRAYRHILQELVDMSVLDRYYFAVDSERLAGVLTKESAKELRRIERKARRRTSEAVLGKLAVRDDAGRARIVDQPPVTRHVDHATLDQLETLFEQYRATLREDTQTVLAQFRLVDYVLRVVGVGSVGTRCYVLLFEGPAGEPLFLQAKEAQPSVLSTYGGVPDAVPVSVPTTGAPTQGHRVVAAQRILQAHSDPFLGWIHGWAGDRRTRPQVDYYWRQFRDMKVSVELDRLTPEQFARYGTLCAQLLARGHSQSPEAAVVAGYLGRSEAFDDAVTTWAASYADQCEADHAALAEAAAAGRVPCERGA